MEDSQHQMVHWDHDQFCNRQGSVRVRFVRKHYGFIDGEQVKPLCYREIDQIKDLYLEWRNTVEMIPIKLTYKRVCTINLSNTPVDPDKWIEKYNMDTGKHAKRFGSSDIVLFDGLYSEWQLKECCKRGNVPYVNQLKYKTRDIKKSKKELFSTVVNERRKRVLKTRMLYITGTSARKYCSRCGVAVAATDSCCSKCGNHAFVDRSISDAWLNFGKDWNRFVSSIRFQFNGCEFLRAWQSQRDGYPHFHALIYFPNFRFTVQRWIEKDGRVSWRVHNRQKLDGVLVRDRIKDAWKWGFLDIKCCDNVKAAFTDLLKYVLRDLEGGESDLTNSMVWYFGKQSFAISQNFRKEVGGAALPSSVEPTDDDLIKAEGFIQSNNSKSELISIEIFPVIRADLLPKSIKNCQKNLDDFEDPPKPPPQIDEKVEYFLENYGFVECRVAKTDCRNGVVYTVYKRGD